LHAGRGFLSLCLKPSLWMFRRLAPGGNHVKLFLSNKRYTKLID
jgi:hypothetical protein